MFNASVLTGPGIGLNQKLFRDSELGHRDVFLGNCASEQESSVAQNDEAIIPYARWQRLASREPKAACRSGATSPGSFSSVIPYTNARAGVRHRSAR